MGLSNESIIALLSLLVTCVPLALLLYRVYKRRRQTRKAAFPALYYQVELTLLIKIIRTTLFPHTHPHPNLFPARAW